MSNESKLSVEEFYNDVAYVKSISGLFGCIDKKMNLLIKPQFSRIYMEYNSYAKILKGNKWGFIDNQCNIIAKPIYDYVNNFSNGFAKVEYNQKFAYITLGRSKHVAVVDVDTHEVKDYILAGARVWGAAITKDDKFLIVTNGNNDNISIIDTEKNAAIKSISVGRTPHTVRILE